jgi:hypothetical protein
MAFLFKLQTADGQPAEPPELTSAVPNWRGATRSRLVQALRALATRDDEAGEEQVLVVEDMAG